MTPLQNKHRVWAEIDLDRLVHNYTLAAKTLRNGKLMPVVKADAYGHGAVRTALALRRAGADFFAVATPEEALQLRRHGIDCALLLLGAAPLSHIPELAREGVTLCVPDIRTARAYKDALRGYPVSAHIKIDTGMTRLGIPYPSAVSAATEIAGILNVTGLFTHFAAADDDGGFTTEQLSRFLSVSGGLRFGNPVLHSANSAALLSLPETHLDYARPGLALYGYSPIPGAGEALKPVLSLHSAVMQCHAVPAGTTVSYGRAWTAARDSVVATVPVGYADGLSWSLSGQEGAFLLVRGVPAPIVGRICMDFCILDVTGLPQTAPGDPVTLLGDGITAADHARLLGTIPWDVLCSIGRRVPRVYRQNGEIIEETNDIDRL
ncbi:MAG: alanine racemase [Oscillospiraceae bacterium]|jgi:alanine racemase|nr:alanine racemase [Oscillospiraceae bacterium]